MIYKHTEYTAYITWKTTCHFSTTLKVNSAHLSKYAWTSMNKSDTLRMLTESIYPIHCYSFPSKCHTREVKIFDFFIYLFFFKLTHQKFSFLHIKKTSCLCNSLIYRERGFLFWLHPGHCQLYLCCEICHSDFGCRLFCLLVTQQNHKRPIHCPSVSRITSGDPDLYQFPANDPNLHR